MNILGHIVEKVQRSGILDYHVQSSAFLINLFHRDFIIMRFLIGGLIGIVINGRTTLGSSITAAATEVGGCSRVSQLMPNHELLNNYIEEILEDLYGDEKKKLCDRINVVNEAIVLDNRDEVQKDFVSFLMSVSEEVKKGYFRSDVRVLAKNCQTTVDELGEIHGYKINPKLKRLETLAGHFDLLSASERMTLCSLARIQRIIFGPIDNKNFNALISKVNSRLNYWPVNRWQSQYEKRCAQNRSFIQIPAEHAGYQDITDRAFSTMKTDDEVYELCQLLGEPVRNGEYPVKEVGELIDAARKLHKFARNLNLSCRFHTLKNRKIEDLRQLERVFSQLTYTERISVYNVCGETDPSQSLWVALVTRFNIPTNDQKIRAPYLDSNCKLKSDWATWGTVTDEMLSTFDRLAVNVSAEKDRKLLCRIWWIYLHDRGEESTEATADEIAITNLDSIMGSN